VPDVYQGAPTPITGFMAAATKAAAFAALVRVFVSTFGGYQVDWRPIVGVLAVLTLVVGAVLAAVQTDLKRTLAYTSLVHAGFILVAVQTATDQGVAAVLFYSLTYGVVILGMFAVLTTVSRRGDVGHDLDAYRGMAYSRPGLALALTLFLMAQAGIPLTAGFFAKFYVVAAAVDAGTYALAIAAMLGAVVAAFVYLRLIVTMYSQTDEQAAHAGPAPRAPRPPIPLGAKLTLAVAVLYTLAAGILPGPVADLARDAAPLLILAG
jgi:NADH-quinone oxidoreductase subunit N